MIASVAVAFAVALGFAHRAFTAVPEQLSPLGQDNPPSGKRPDLVAEQYAALCATCHGSTLGGSAQAPSLLADPLLHGSDDESLVRSIREGYPDKGMPAWKHTLTEAQIRSLVILIREHRHGILTNDQGRKGTLPSVPSGVLKSEQHNFLLETLIDLDDGLEQPWSMALLPSGEMLVTEKGAFARQGGLRRFGNNMLAREQIDGFPPSAQVFDVRLHPDYVQNQWVYVSSQQSVSGESWMVVQRGRIRDNRWTDAETILRLSGGNSLTARIAFDDRGYLYLTTGTTEPARGADLTRAVPQNLSHAGGKIHRVHDDGRVPDDNPFLDRPGALPSIWSYGHRNPQGLTFDTLTSALWSTEHGPRGGDELNCVLPGRNYGYPVITYGMNYDGTAISLETARGGMEQPVLDWTPAVGVSNLVSYQGKAFSKWRGNLLVTSLKQEKLFRLVIAYDRVVHQEVILQNIGRLRDLAIGPDGFLYLLAQFQDSIDGRTRTRGRVVRLVPADVAQASLHDSVRPMPRNEPAWWMERHELLNRRVAEAGKKAHILFIGDSITQGWEQAGQAV